METLPYVLPVQGRWPSLADGWLLATRKYAIEHICTFMYILGVMAEVIATDEFAVWFEELDEADTKAVVRVVDLLEARGVSLGFPYSSDIKSSRYALRELRVQSGGSPLRILYAFDPKRQAVLLLGADKTGMSDERFYTIHIPKAESLWQEYLMDRE